MNVYQKAGLDLNGAFKKFPVSFVQEALTVAKDKWVFFSSIESPEEEGLVIAIAKARYLQKYPQNKSDSYHYHLDCFFKTLVSELHNYLPEVRASVIDAALKEIAGPVQMAGQLEKIYPEVKAAWQRLDPRSRAAIKIIETLMGIDSILDTDFMLVFHDTADFDVSALRSDPALAALLEAYDLAVEYKAEVE